MTDEETVEALLGQLSLEEKAALTAGAGGMFSAAGVERLGIPNINLSDGPNGARGPFLPFFDNPPTACVPCGSALGATWNPELAEEVGVLLARETLRQSCRFLLAPTVNLHRSPLAGRNFECYSEDPYLTGKMASGYVRGIQSEGVAATVKHFVGNEAELERNSMNSVIDERTLRELYFVPFELVVKEGGVLSVMTSYNRVNGRWVTQQPELLTDLLRDEWGFDGIVMTDWFAIADTEVSLAAGLDLEMPGPGRALGTELLPAIERGVVDVATLDRAVRRLLTTYSTGGGLTFSPSYRQAPLTREQNQLLSRAAAESIVLVRNDGILPLAAPELGTVAVIGTLAQLPTIQGGGSAKVTPHSSVSPFDELTSVFGGAASLLYERACEFDLSSTVIGTHVLTAPKGFEVELFNGTECKGTPFDQLHVAKAQYSALGHTDEGFPADDWSARLQGTIISEESGILELALIQCGRARVLLDGVVVADGFDDPPPPGGTEFMGLASKDLVFSFAFERWREVELVIEYARLETHFAAFRLGFRTPSDGADLMMDRAVEVAASADVALVFVGTSGEWETEGRDRTSLKLPGRQDELVRRVAAVNSRTVVVVNAGAAVELPWVDDVSAVLWSWFGGEGMASALAQVLSGQTDPGGRLPITLPECLEHSPSHGNFPGENGEVRYGENLFMGYRGFEHRRIKPLFPFGHGLSYTKFSYGDPELSSGTFQSGEKLSVKVPVTNVGGREGFAVVQCYVAPPPSRLQRPAKELKGFAKLWLDAGETKDAEIVLDERSFAYWDPGQADWDEISKRPWALGFESVVAERRSPGWMLDDGVFGLLLGESSQNIVAEAAVAVTGSPTGFR